MEWIITDPSCNQRCRKISDTIFEYEEDRIINPETKETEKYNSIINLDDYSIGELKDGLHTFGYHYFNKKFINSEGNKISNQIITECMFELEN